MDLRVCRCCFSLPGLLRCDKYFRKARGKGEPRWKAEIEVTPHYEEVLPTKICRQCFRKLTVLVNGVKEFREVCFETNQKLQLEKARLKRGRNACSPTQAPQQKRHKQTQTAEFAVHHFNGNILPTVEVVQTRNNNLSPSRVRTSSFPEQLISTVDFAYSSCSCCRDKQRSQSRWT